MVIALVPLLLRCSQDASQAGTFPSILLIGMRAFSFKTWLITGSFLFATVFAQAAVPDLAKTVAIDLGDGVTMEFVLIQSGSFLMGSGPEIGDADETPQHRVTLTHPYYLGKYEVTQTQWEKILGTNPSIFKGPQHPVDSVSWDDCQIFLAKLKEKTGRVLALPTEAEWEYACSAGATTRWSFGDDPLAAGEFAWQSDNSGNTTHPVGEKKPNAWGLYDMHGNVWEWCSDWYTRPYPQSAVTDPHHPGPLPDTSPVLRGGGWGEHPINARSAYRNCSAPDQGHNGTGLRCMMLIDSQTASAK